MAGLQSETDELLALAERLEGEGVRPPADSDQGEAGADDGAADGLPAVTPPISPCQRFVS